MRAEPYVISHCPAYGAPVKPSTNTTPRWLLYGATRYTGVLAEGLGRMNLPA
jgi:hypothetical protein